jgi:hypothetical protein
MENTEVQIVNNFISFWLHEISAMSSTNEEIIRNSLNVFLIVFNDYTRE